MTAPATEPHPLRRNPALMCAFHALTMSLFPVAIITLFYLNQIGMSWTQVLVMQGLFGLAMALFEFPSGYLADRVGYRRTLLLASLVIAIGWAVYCVADNFWQVLVAEVVLGIGMSLISGTDQAIMYESLVELGDEASYSKWDGRFRFSGQMAEGSAALGVGLLYAWWARSPFVIEVAVWAVAALVAWRLVEPSRHRPQTRQHWREIRAMFRYSFIDNRKLTSIVFFTIVLGMSSYVPVWLIPKYATGAGVSEAWIGPIWAAANYTVAFGSLWSDRITRTFGLLPTLLACVVLIAAGYLGLALSYGLFGFGFYYLLTLMRGLFGPALLHQEQRLLPSDNRAGYLSLRSLVFRVTFFGLSPIVGAGVDHYGMHPVFMGLGIGLTLAAVVGWLWVVSKLRYGQPPTSA